MRKIGFIPVRGGSKSIQLKNIRLFCKEPLVYWAGSAGQKSSQLDQIVIATDDPRIKEIVAEFNFSKLVIFDRSEANASDTASTESVMLEYIDQSNLNDEDVFVLIQATSPFTTEVDLDKALELYLDSEFDSLLSCCRTKRFYWSDNGVPINYDFKNRPRRQDFKGTYCENGAFYINTVANIKTSSNRLSGNIGIFEMADYTILELDEEEDWRLGESLMYKHQLKPIKAQIKVVLTDVDGVLTDAGMYISELGDELKKFSTYDGMAFEILRKQGIKTGIITKEKTELVSRRAQKLKCNHIYTGIENKLEILEKICREEQISFENVAYVGDDINDLEVLTKVGLAACPINAQEAVKNVPGIVQLNKKGGEGVIRELLNYII